MNFKIINDNYSESEDDPIVVINNGCEIEDDLDLDITYINNGCYPKNISCNTNDGCPKSKISSFFK